MIKVFVVSVVALSFLCLNNGRSTGRTPCVRHLESLNYNPIVRQARLQGDVPVEVSVDANGKVESVRILPTGAHFALQQEATNNIRQWTFEPEGKQTFNITYEFRLVQPEVDGFSPTTVSVDFPDKIHITCNLKTINRD
jgi:TonB family protein